MGADWSAFATRAWPLGTTIRRQPAVFNGMLYVLCTGCPWRDMHERYRKWNSVYVRFRRWAE
ncbi:transposase [Gluconobacter sp. NFX36]|uniref:transposase n=1 Tax=Gluconobacter japonicus TaxID=376620 RepID=UPI003D2E73CD